MVQVNMCEENSEGAIFKILPRYKVRSEGDGVSEMLSVMNWSKSWTIAHTYPSEKVVIDFLGSFWWSD